MEETRVCKKCGEEKPVSEFRDSKIQRYFRCRTCYNTYQREWDDKNPEKARNRELRWNERGRLKKYYGITPDDYNRVFNAQDGRCAICGKHQGEFSKRLFVDHDHETGSFRGLLCHRCNLIIGHAHDNPDILMSAVNYLKRE